MGLSRTISNDAAVYRLQSFPGTLYDQDVQCVVVRSSSLKEQAETRIEQDVDDDGRRTIPANVDVPERVLELLDLSVEVYGVEHQ